ncbi:MAG: chromosomal replication initiator protein DnaA [Fimbriimonadales bacterium]
MSRRKDDESVEQLRLGEDIHSAQIRRAWRNVYQALIHTATPSTQRYLKEIEPVGQREEVILLQLNNRFGREWIERRYRTQIENLLSQQLGFPVRIQLVGEDTAEAPLTEPAPVAPVLSAPAPQLPRPNFIPHYTFDTFVVGATNRLAYAAAQVVAEMPGKRYNPFFIYSMPGLGKTHLLHAIGQAFLERVPDGRVLYISGEQFVRDYVNAIQAKRTDEFRQRYRGIQLWLMDDVQFIAGKERSQEEFFHIYNELHSIGCALVMTSDKPPRDLLGLEERLRSRFEQGLCTDIRPPDFETRVAILKTKAEREGIPLTHDILEFIADKVQSNVRVLEGVLTRIMAQSSLYKIPISLDLASEALREYYIDAPPQPITITVQRVLEAVSDEFGIPTSELTGRSRRGDIVPIRQIAIFAARELTGETWERIAHAFGRNDHTTALHAYQQAESRIHKDPKLRERFQVIREKLQRKNAAPPKD